MRKSVYGLDGGTESRETLARGIHGNCFFYILEKFLIIESLSSDLFERRTSIRSELFAHLSCDFEQTFGQIVSVRVRTLNHTNLVASRHIKREKKLTSG